MIEHGQWPLWNPYRMLGQPFAANPLSKAWYPPQWLVFLLPPVQHLNVMIYLHMVAAAAGIACWMRSGGLSRAAALFAAVSWALLPKSMAHLGAGHLDIVYALAWVPWLLAAIQRMIGQPSPRTVAATALCGALLLLADIRMAFYFGLLAAAYALVLTALQPPSPPLGRRWQVPAAAVLAGGLALLLSAVQIVPVLVLSPYLTRASLTPAEAGAFSLAPARLLGLLIPDYGGFHEMMTYTGLPVLALAVAALACWKGLNYPRRVLALFWTALVLLAAAWALGEYGPFFPAAARMLPALSWFRVPSRAWFVASFGLIVLSAHGLDALSVAAGRVRRLATAGLAMAGVVWLATVLFLLAPGSTVAIRLLGAGAGLLLSGAGLWLLDALPANSRVRWLRTGVLITGQGVLLVVLARSVIAPRPADVAGIYDDAILDSIGPFCDMVYSPSFDLLGVETITRGIPTLHGADPFQLAWTAHTIAEATGVEAAGYSIASPPLPGTADDATLALRDAQPDADLLAGLRVGYVAARFPLEGIPGLEPIPVDAPVYLYRVTLNPTELISTDTVDEAPRGVAGGPVMHRACGQKPDLALQAQYDGLAQGGITNGVLVSGQAWAPGWQAWVDGERATVVRVGGVLAGVQLPSEGLHTVRLVYRPAADLAGIALSAAGLIVLGMLLGVRRKPDAPR
ncbi:MAG: hypothetical protein IT326_03785 [Anaerolineae bacterium]|nr:hypothetical protein [Anaerolineae bacterium]